MKIVKYLTTFSIFTVIMGTMFPANAITYTLKNVKFDDGSRAIGQISFNDFFTDPSITAEAKGNFGDSFSTVETLGSSSKVLLIGDTGSQLLLSLGGSLSSVDSENAIPLIPGREDTSSNFFNIGSAEEAIINGESEVRLVESGFLVPKSQSSDPFETFNFSFGNNNESVEGVITLPDTNGTFSATSVVITSAPKRFDTESNFDWVKNANVNSNRFTISNSQITDFNFQSFGSELTLTPTSATFSDNGNSITTSDNPLQSQSQQPVPFEAEGTIGLVALGGFFGYRYYKKRKQALSK